MLKSIFSREIKKYETFGVETKIRTGLAKGSNNAAKPMLPTNNSNNLKNVTEDAMTASTQERCLTFFFSPSRHHCIAEPYTRPRVIKLLAGPGILSAMKRVDVFRTATKRQSIITCACSRGMAQPKPSSTLDPNKARKRKVCQIWWRE